MDSQSQGPAKAKRLTLDWAAIRKNLSSLAVLGTIGGIAAWGHHTHWKFGGKEHHAPSVPVASPAEAQAEPQPSQLAETDAAAPGVEQAADLPIAPDATRIEFESPRTIAKSGIELVEATEQEVDQLVTANAVVSYDQTRLAQLATRVPGTVWRVEKRVGQPIKQGDVLAIVEANDVGQAKSDFLEAVATVEYHRLTLERLKSLQANVVSGRQVLQAEADLKRSQIGLFNSQQALVNLGLPIHLAEIAELSSDALVQKVRFLGLPEPITRDLDPETTTANLIPLFAPFDGVVLGRDVVVGEAASPAQPQFVMADVSHMWLRLDVRQELAGQIRLGQDVSFRAEGMPHDVTSRVSWISTEVDPKTRTVEVRADVTNLSLGDDAEGAAHVALRANTFGSGSIRIRSNSSAVVAPNQAVQWDGERHLVFVQSSPKSFEVREVEPGIVGDDLTEIRSGLAAGEVIAGVGSHVLKSEVLRVRLAGG